MAWHPGFDADVHALETRLQQVFEQIRIQAVGPAHHGKTDVQAAPEHLLRNGPRAPTAPLAWCLEGLERGAALGLLDVADASRAQRALRGHPETVFSHGDALLRNVLRTPSGLVAVDWECAGLHPEGWDLALLWPALYPHQKRNR